MIWPKKALPFFNALSLNAIIYAFGLFSNYHNFHCTNISIHGKQSGFFIVFRVQFLVISLFLFRQLGHLQT